MDSTFKKMIDNKKDDIKEQIYTNLNFLIKHYKWKHNKDFFESISKETGIPQRTIFSWYYKEKLPELHHQKLTILTSSLKVHLSDFIATDITEDKILSYNPQTFIPSNIAKMNILELLITHGINSPEKFELFLESNYSSNYFYVLQRKRSHLRNISWTFIITTAHFLDVPIGNLFKIKED